MKEIPLSQGMTAFVDESDYDLLIKTKWSASKKSEGRFYAFGHTKNGGTLMHRAIMGVYDPAIIIDHIDGNPLNNQRNNLRMCTQSENMMNRAPNKGKKYKGVFKCGWVNKFRAGIKHNKKNIYLGYFYTEEEAAMAYDKAALSIFGAHAKLNFAACEHPG